MRPTTTTTVMSARPRNDLVWASVFFLFAHSQGCRVVFGVCTSFLLVLFRKTGHGLLASTIVASLVHGISYGINWIKRSDLAYAVAFLRGVTT